MDKHLNKEFSTMKKAILSPLCSALVIPGLGQVMNQHIKKGVIMLAAVFVFLVAFTVQMYRIITAVMKSGAIKTGDPFLILDKIKAENYSTLYLLLAAFCVLWIYSIVDAFLGGRKADNLDHGGLP
jgi:TM2 domain-containing membrane protein YozV